MFNWIQHIADYLTYSVFNLEKGTHLADAVDFFIYDTTKILLLLTVIVFVMSIINTYFPVDRVRNYLTTHKLYGLEYLMASLFGVVTPFCSCSSVPLFIGFVKGGIPLGVTFAFLVTSPLVNEVAIGLFLGMFGVKVTAIYVVSGVVLGTLSGFILDKFKLERFLTDWVKQILNMSQAAEEEMQAEKVPFSARVKEAWQETLKILKGVVLYVIGGIAIGGIIHGYVPQGFFEQYMGKNNSFAVPISVILAVPMYSNASGMIPILQVLVEKGIPLGTALAFMMGVVGLSLPEAMLLKKVMTWKLIGVFFGTVALNIIILGYFFNIIF
jgi:hypothetical protein